MAAAGDGVGGGGGGGEQLTVLGAWGSPFLVRVRLALNLKGLSYEYVEVDLAGKSDLLLAANPVHGKIPVLLHAGRPVCESMLIVEYLDEAFPSSAAGHATILPADDPNARAVARFWAAYVDDELLSGWMGIYDGGKTGEEKAAALARTRAALDALEGALGERTAGEGGWFGGDRVGLVDVALGGFVPAIVASEPTTGLRIVDASRTPLLAAWVERFCALDEAKAAMPPLERLIAAGKKRYADLQAAAAAAAASASE